MEQQLLRLGHSPDPDDAFMFYGLARDLIPTGRWKFEHVLQDIQTLNQRAMKGELEITAISIHAYPYVADRYALTSCGSSMGDQYGPMIVCRADRAKEFGDGTLPNLRGKKIAIPGKLTTAFLAMQLAAGKAGEDYQVEVVMFDQIPKYVTEGKADAGLLIHEGQLTYAQAGLHLLLDLGKWWHEQTGLPLPLGGNAIRRELGPELIAQVTKALRDSIQFALDHREPALAYAMQFARDLDSQMADRFVGMYVNDRTLDYGEDGKRAVVKLLDMGYQAGIIPHKPAVEFV